jgi:hypothetical protein
MRCLRLMMLLLISIFGLSAPGFAEICCPNGFVQCISSLTSPCADQCEKIGAPGIQTNAQACRPNNRNNPLAGGGKGGGGVAGGIAPIGFGK